MALPSFPSIDPLRTQQEQEARKTELQSAFGQAVASGQPLGGPAGIQRMGAQAATAVKQPAVAGVERAAQALGQQAVLASGEQQIAAKRELANRALLASRKRSQLESSLANLGADLKGKLLDDQVRFERDNAGRALFNERQLLDFTLASAKSDEEFASYEQQVTQLSNRRMKLLDVSLSKIKQALEQGFDERNQQLDFEAKKKLAIAKQQLEEKMRREKAKQASRAAMFAAAGTLVAVGIAASPLVGAGATGLLAAGVLGQGAGTMAAGLSGG